MHQTGQSLNHNMLKFIGLKKWPNVFIHLEIKFMVAMPWILAKNKSNPTRLKICFVLIYLHRSLCWNVKNYVFARSCITFKKRGIIKLWLFIRPKKWEGSTPKTLPVMTPLVESYASCQLGLNIWDATQFDSKIFLLNFIKSLVKKAFKNVIKYHTKFNGTCNQRILEFFVKSQNFAIDCDWFNCK